jgi:cyclic pyranopterin phosphate synthase
VSHHGGLVDGFGRIHTDLRVSVTDRCNMRCRYCMPLEATFLPRAALLTFEEIARVVGLAAGMGIRTVRLTGGEPLLRRDLHRLVAMLVATSGIEEVSLTTNGLLLAEQAQPLADAGLGRLNVSLDSLDEEAFRLLGRIPAGVGRGPADVVAGLLAARRAGFHPIRINAVARRGLTEREIVALATFALAEGFHLRFIEFMPLDAEQGWSRGEVLEGAEIRRLLEPHLGPFERVEARDPGQPAVDYYVAGRQGFLGFIEPVSSPFCDRCDRLRLTADGQFRNCLFSTTEWDIRALLRGGCDDAAVVASIADCLAAKRRAHGIGEPAFERPERAMYQIGG